MFSYIRWFFSFIMLLFSSYEDIKTREISDKVWIFFIPIGITITLIEYYLKFIDFSILIFYFSSIIITIIVSIVIYYSKFVGGADSKALITLSFLDPINLDKNVIHPFTSIIVLTNSCIISLIIPIFLFIYNLYRILKKEKIFEGFENEKLYRKIFALFIGYKTKKYKNRFATSIEKNIDGKKKFVFSLLENEIEFIKNENVWVTPSLPLIVFLLFGYVINILYGDIISILLNYFFSFK